jgi:hypothetical protein
MSRRHHLICLTAAAGLVLWVLLAGSGGLAVAGLSLALLVCPLVMGGVMWMLMRRPQSAPLQRATNEHTLVREDRAAHREKSLDGGDAGPVERTVRWRHDEWRP